MMIFILHFYSTAAIPYMGVQGGGGNSRRSPLSGKFFPCGFLFTLWESFSPCGGPFPPCGSYKHRAFSSCRGLCSP